MEEVGRGQTHKDINESEGIQTRSAELSKDDYFCTDNLFLIAYCMSQKLNLLGKELVGSKYTVHFEGPGAKQIAEDYFNKNPKSDGYKARELFNFYKTARDYTHNADFYRQRHG